MKKVVSLLILAVFLLTILASCAPAPSAPAASAEPDPAETKPTDPPAAPEQPAETPAEEAPVAAPQTLKYADEVEKFSTIYEQGTYFDNYENYKDFAADGKFKVAFVCKFLTSTWFGPKSAGMKQQADKLGLEYIGIDANSSEDGFMQGLHNAVNQDADAIILTPVTAAMLPSVVDICKEAGVAYITTDDGGNDADGNRIPHLGLDDFSLCYASGKAMGEAAVQRGFDVSSLKIAMLDAPAVESIRGRSMGAYKALMDVIPGLTDDNFIWLDTVDNLTDNNLNKLSSAFQANKATTKYWMVYCGGNNVWEAAFPIFDENGVDYKNVICGGLVTDLSIVDYISGSEDKANSLFCTGVLPAPSGVALMDLCYDLFQNGTRFPNFSEYPMMIVSASNIDAWIDLVNASN